MASERSMKKFIRSRQLVSVFLIVFISVSFLGTLISHVEAMSFSDGFESNSFANWTSTEGTPGETEIITTDTPHSGIYTALFYCNGNTSAEESEAYKYLDWTQAEANLTFWFRVSTNFPTDGNSFIIGKFGATDGTDLAYIKVRNLWGLYVRLKMDYRKNGVWFSQIYNTTNLSLNTWYQVSLNERINATSGSVSISLNGVAALSDSGFKNDNYGDIQRIAVGEIYDSEAIEHSVRIDDVSLVGSDTIIQPPEQGSGELIFQTDFSDVVKSSDRYLTKVGQPTGTFALNLQGGNPLRSWFEYDDIRDTFWVDDTQNPTRWNTPASGPNGDRYVIGMETAYSQRCEFNLINIQDWLEYDTLYTSVWLYFPSNWDLNQADNWLTLAVPYLGVGAGNYPGSGIPIWKEASGRWYTSAYIKPRSSTIEFINTVDNYHPPINEWFNLRMYIKQSTTHGALKVWINNQVIADTDRDAPPGDPAFDDIITLGNGTWQWQQTIADVYHGPNYVAQNPMQLWVGRLEIYDNLPSTLDTTPPTFSSVAHNTTVMNSHAKFSALLQDNVGLSSRIFSWNSSGSWLNESVVKITGSSVWANVTEVLPNVLGQIVGYKWFFNDTSDLWNKTETFSLVTTAASESVTILLNTPGNWQGSAKRTVLFTFTPIFKQEPRNASLWYSAVGVGWHVAAWNSSSILNGTYNWISYTFPAVFKYYTWNIRVYNSSIGILGQHNRTLVLNPYPTYGDAQYSSDIAGSNSELSIEWRDEDGLSGYIASTNVTGAWANETWTQGYWNSTTTDGYARITKTLPSIADQIISFRFYANDSDGLWTTTSVESFTTVVGTSPGIAGPGIPSENWLLARISKWFPVLRIAAVPLVIVIGLVVLYSYGHSGRGRDKRRDRVFWH